jgi:hypothetical protein
VPLNRNPLCNTKPHCALVDTSSKIGQKKNGSVDKESSNNSNPITSDFIVVSNDVFRLRASATLFNAPDLCLMVKENCCTKAAHLACRADNLS